MGFNSLNSAAIILDLETVAIDGVEAYLEAPTAPANYKDEAKIAAYLEDARAKAAAQASLDPDLARIVALGWMQEGRDSAPQVLVCLDEDDERRALEALWHAVLVHQAPRRLVTFNGLGFDLPVLMRRSLYLDVPHPFLNLDRYRTPHTDLMQWLSFNGAIKAHGLQFYKRRFGLDVPEDTTTGAQIAALVAANQWDAVRTHCAADVLTTYALAERMGVIEGRVADAEVPL